VFALFANFAAAICPFLSATAASLPLPSAPSSVAKLLPWAQGTRKSVLSVVFTSGVYVKENNSGVRASGAG
jgi:hypothetical protein